MSTNFGFQNWEMEEAGELKIGDRIAIILAKKGMSQRELANKIHCTEVSVSRYINNTRALKATILVEIAKALGVSTDVLLGIVPEKTDWIPCSKRLPEVEGTYLVTMSSKATEEDLGFLLDDIEVKKMRYLGNSWRTPVHIPKWINDAITHKVLAWMPLPEPYEPKEGKNE